MGLGSFFKRGKKEEKVVESHIDINNSDCDVCEKCITACPNNVLQVIDNEISVRDPQVCRICRVCMAICSNNCITVN